MEKLIKWWLKRKDEPVTWAVVAWFILIYLIQTLAKYFAEIIVEGIK